MKASYKVRLTAQNCRLTAQNCRLITANSWGKRKVLTYITYIRVCFHSLHSFKHTIKGLRSALESLACLLSENIKERKKYLVLWRAITNFVNLCPFVLCVFSSLRGEYSLSLRVKRLAASPGGYCMHTCLGAYLKESIYRPNKEMEKGRIIKVQRLPRVLWNVFLNG